MSHFAHVNSDGVVDQVVVAEQEFIDTGIVGDGWIQTSYNTHGGQHPEGKPLRKNYAGVGFKYNKDLDAFIPQKPQEDAILDVNTGLWKIKPGQEVVR